MIRLSQSFRVINVALVESEGYIICGDGNIVSTKGKFPRVLKEGTNNCGYKVVNLRIRGKSTLYLVHRLVAFKYVDIQSDRPYVNHKDGNKANNHSANLEWCSHSENVQHAYDTGLLVLT